MTRIAMLVALLFACLAMPAHADMPPPDLAASPWLASIAQRLYAEGRGRVLLADCVDDGHYDEGVVLGLAFAHAVETLPPADQAYASRLNNTGGEDGLQALKADQAAACRWLTPTLLARLRALGTGQAGYWQPASSASEAPFPTATVRPERRGTASAAPRIVRQQQDGAGIDQPYHRDLVRLERLAFLCGRELPDGPLRTQLTDGYDSEFRELNSDDQALATRLGAAGQADAAAELRANKMAACAQLSPVIMAKLRNLAAGLGSFFRQQ